MTSGFGLRPSLPSYHLRIEDAVKVKLANNDDNDDGDDIYIMMKCVSVCL